MIAIIAIGCIFGYAQIGFIAGGLIHKHFEKVNHTSYRYRKYLTEDQRAAACLGGIFWPVGSLIGLGFLLFKWEYRVLINKQAKRPKRAKRSPLNLRHRKVPDHEAIAKMERELEIKP